eukprot:COSAG01_NODE_2747_length_7149_cov_5.321844_8_plen_53_part_00
MGVPEACGGAGTKCQPSLPASHTPHSDCPHARARALLLSLALSLLRAGGDGG